MTVILRRNPANEVIAANLYLLGGARQLTPANAGIEALMLAGERARHEALPGCRACGSRPRRSAARSRIEANDDWSAIGLHAIRSTFDSTWAILADRVMAPTLAPAEVEMAREQMIAGARQRDDASRRRGDGSSRTACSTCSIRTRVPPTGTPASLASLTVAAAARVSRTSSS